MGVTPADPSEDPFVPRLPNPWHAGQRYLTTAFPMLRDGWNRFWFAPRSAYWLGILRIAAGLIVLYSHWIWGWDLEGFLGPDRRLPEVFLSEMNPTPWHWSVFDLSDNVFVLWTIHWVAMLCFLSFLLGLGMPWTGWLAVIFSISYAHRATGALFGLDQMNVALVTYLTLGRAGRHWSLDRWFYMRRQRERGLDPAIVYDPWTTVGTRLIQLQLCIIYWFAGTGKLLGESWWNGGAMWGALASYQYQSWDLTWLHQAPLLLALLTHLTIFWEISYLFLVWPRWSRPLVITIAMVVHGGIGLFLGMMTFGYVMMVANLAFVQWRGLFPPASHHPDALPETA